MRAGSTYKLLAAAHAKEILLQQMLPQTCDDAFLRPRGAAWLERPPPHQVHQDHVKAAGDELQQSCDDEIRPKVTPRSSKEFFQLLQCLHTEVERTTCSTGETWHRGGDVDGCHDC